MSTLARFLDRLLRRGDPDAPQRLPSPDELALAATAESVPEAQMLREMLENDGIRAMVKNRTAVSVMYGFPSALCEIWVLRRDLARAKALLEVEEEPDGE